MDDEYSALSQYLPQQQDGGNGDPLLPDFPQLPDAGNGDPLLPHFSQLPDGVGLWDADYDLSLDFGLHGDPLDDLFDLFASFDDDLLGTKQAPPADSSSGVNHVQEDDAADPSSGIGCLQREIIIPAAGAGMYRACDAPLDGQTPVAAAVAASTDATTGQVPTPAAANMLSTAEADLETMEIAEMVRVAAQCGEDDARNVWSEEEQKQLLHLLDLYATDDAVTRCFKIAFHLPKKTALDVAMRCRWLQDKRKKTAAGTGSTAPGRELTSKVVKVKGTKIAKTKNKSYPLSKEALDSKSNKQLIEDNNMFLKLIEENLKTGQLVNIPDYFYYVKTNMDAIQARGSKFGISMTSMPPIDEQGLEEILQARLKSLALAEDA